MPLSLMELLRRYRRDERGVVSVMAVGALVLSLAVAMIVIDAGAMLYARRDLQAATDAAALGAVRQLESAEAAQAAAASIFDMNDYPTDGVTTMRGVYAADPSLAPEDRFTEESAIVEPNPAFNAIRVFNTAQSPTYFARVFGFGDLTQINAISTAAYVKTVSFSAGTRLADITDEGLPNQILGGLLGTSLTLSLANYEGLAQTNVSALAFLDALATEIGLEAGSDTYGDLLEANVTMSDLVSAAVEVLGHDTCAGACSIPSNVRAQLSTGGTSVPLNEILGVAPFADRIIGSVSSSLSNGQTFNAFDLLSGAAMVMGEGQAVAFDIAGVSPLASVSGTITVGQGLARMSVGKVGDSVQTSQIDVQLTTEIGINIPLLLDTTISLPIFIRVAHGTATVSDIPCNRNGTMAVLSGSTEAGAARVGTGLDGPSAILSLNLLGGFIPLNVPISGSVPIGGSGPTEVAFTKEEFGQPKAISSDIAVLSQLAGAISIGASGGVLTGLTSAISGAMLPLETILNSLLATLGVKVGTMDMIVSDVKCNAPTLVL